MKQSNCIFIPLSFLKNISTGIKKLSFSLGLALIFLQNFCVYKKLYTFANGSHTFCIYKIFAFTKNYIHLQTALIPFAFMLEVTRAGQNVAKSLQIKPYEAGIGREKRVETY